MIDWTKSMAQRFEYYEVDAVTWKDKRKLSNVLSCSINRDAGSDILGSATIENTEYISECYVRIYLIATQNGIEYKIPLGTYLVETPSTKFDGTNKKISMSCYTPLLELKENPPPLGYSLSKDMNILDEAYKIIRENSRAPVVQTSSDKVLLGNFVANDNDTWIMFIRDLLAQAKYKISLDEIGRIIFIPNQEIEQLKSVWTYDDDNSSILFPEVTSKLDLVGIPNVVEVVCSTGTERMYAKAENTDPNSITSIQNRGRMIIHRDTNPKIQGHPTQEQLNEYAKTLLKELSSVDSQITYKHGYCPVRLGDGVRLNYKKAGLYDIHAKVVSQSITCDMGCSVEETAVFTRKLWK